jgi:hypothetical protein
MRNKKRRFTRPTIDEMDEFKQFLGPKLASGYNEGELRQLREDMHAMAEILLDLHMEKKRQDGSNPEEV